MTRAFSYDSLLKCVSALILISVVSIVIVETDILPVQYRHSMRAAVHQTGDKVTRLPVVSDVLRKFGY
jgi:hypothetical protein